MAHRVFATLGIAVDVAVEGLKAMANLPEAMMRLAGRKWILPTL
jgi:hypothetical protein